MVELEKDLERDEERVGASPSSSHVFGALVVGAAAGAALALLYAPTSGAATRTYFSRKARTGRRRAKAVLQRGRDTFDAGRTGLSSAVQEGQARWRQIKEHAEGALQEGREAGSRILAHGRQAAAEVKESLDRIGPAAARFAKHRR